MSDMVEFRSVVEEDFSQIKKLHEDLFPVRYSDTFYREVCSSGQGHTNFFNSHDDSINWNQSEELSKHRGMPGRFFYAGFSEKNMFSCVATVTTPAANLIESESESYEIVGFILAQLTPFSRCADRNNLRSKWLYSWNDGGDDEMVCYILTLGTKPSYRRTGLGSKLINICVSSCQTTQLCSSIYLHVIHYNDAAISFYQKNNFKRLATLHEFYKIQGNYHTAFLYIMYLKEQQPSLFDRIFNFSRNIIGGLFNWLAYTVPRLRIFPTLPSDSNVIRFTDSNREKKQSV
eukprot:gene38703-52286_t